MDLLSTEMSEDAQQGCRLVTTSAPRELFDCGLAFYERNSWETDELNLATNCQEYTAAPETHNKYKSHFAIFSIIFDKYRLHILYKYEKNWLQHL